MAAVVRVTFTVTVSDEMIQSWDIDTDDPGEDPDEDVIHDEVMHEFTSDPGDFIERCGGSVEPVTVEIIG